METMAPPRRVVTGIRDGRSCILIDGPAATTIWTTDRTPADNRSEADAGAAAFRFPAQGSRFIVHDFPPGGGSPMHATDTIDPTAADS